MRKYILIIICSLLPPSMASADWYVDITGPDVFGEKSAILSANFYGTENDHWRLECKSTGSFSLNWLIGTIEPMPDVRPLMGNIVMKANNGEPFSVSAKLKQWNNKFVSFATNNDPKVISMLKSASGAKIKIDIGYIIPEIDAKVSDSIGMSGSFAINQFINHCGLK